MSEFGQPARTAQRDANEGIVNPPSVQRSAEQSATRVETTQLNTQQLGSNLGNALAGVVERNRNESRATRAMQAAARQGREKAINSIDKDRKRTGWDAAIFGQSIEYRTAQQQAVKNNLNSMYIDQMVRMDEYSGETSEEYSTRLNDALAGILKPFESDSETSQMLTAQWAEQSERLVAAQAKNHYAYTQMQMREGVLMSQMQSYDMIQAELGHLSNEDEAVDLAQRYVGSLSPENRPAGMSEEAFKSVRLEGLETSLRQGNLTALRIADADGFTKTLGKQEQVKLDQAISAYDTDFQSRVSTTIEEALLGVGKVKSYDEAMAVIDEAESAVESHVIRMSGTDKSELTIATARRRLQDIRNRALASAAKGEGDAIVAENIKNALKENDPIIRSKGVATADNGTAPTQRQLEEGMDSVMIDKVSELTGAEITNNGELIEAIGLQPHAAAVVAEFWSQRDFNSPSVKLLANAAVRSVTQLVNEDHQPTDRALTIMNSVSQFAEINKAKFVQNIGENDYARYEITREGIESGFTSDMIQNNLKRYDENRGNLEKWAATWPLSANQSKRDYIANVVQRQTKVKPVESVLSKHMETYSRGLQIYEGDHDKAAQYLGHIVNAQKVQYNGRMLQDGKRLNDLTQFDFKTLMDTAQTPSLNKLSPYISAMLGNTQDAKGVPIRTLDQVPNWEMYTKDGVSGVFLYSPDAKHEVQITDEVLVSWADEVNQNIQFAKMKDAEDRELLMRQQERDRVTNRALGLGPF